MQYRVRGSCACLHKRASTAGAYLADAVLVVEVLALQAVGRVVLLGRVHIIKLIRGNQKYDIL